MQEIYEKSMARTSFALTMLAIAGGMALLLGAIGIYGVISYSVSQRTREIGIRMALGASRGSVVWLVMREVAWLAAAGLGIGLASAWGLTRLVAAQLFEIRPSDPATLVLATAGIALVAALAGYFPARKATGIDPTRALRFE